MYKETNHDVFVHKTSLFFTINQFLFPVNSQKTRGQKIQSEKSKLQNNRLKLKTLLKTFLNFTLFFCALRFNL